MDDPPDDEHRPPPPDPQLENLSILIITLASKPMGAAECCLWPRFSRGSGANVLPCIVVQTIVCLLQQLLQTGMCTVASKVDMHQRCRGQFAATIFGNLTLKELLNTKHQHPQHFCGNRKQLCFILHRSHIIFNCIQSPRTHANT